MYTMSTTAVVLIQSIVVAGCCYIPAVAGIMLLRRLAALRWAGGVQYLVPYSVGTVVCVIAANMLLFRGHPDPNWAYSRSLGGLVAGIAASLTVYGIARFGAGWGDTTRVARGAKAARDPDTEPRH